jgi:hypothetical protein
MAGRIYQVDHMILEVKCDGGALHRHSSLLLIIPVIQVPELPGLSSVQNPTTCSSNQVIR